MRPLVEKLEKFKAHSQARFHMPGHNGKSFVDPSIDITEIYDMDNLLNSNAVILDAEKLVAKAYNKTFALFSTQGSTLFMHVCINIAKNENLKVIALNDMHSSFYNAIKLYNVESIDAKSVEEVENICRKTQSKCAIFTTSPNYFGQCIDLDKLNKVSKKYDAKLIVDSAHGAHFAYSSLLPKKASDYAEITFYSMHKTMSCLTGAAVLVCDDEKLYDLAKYFRSIIHSTSPSYIIMASMDGAREEFEKNGEEYYKAIKKKIDSFKGTLGGFEIIKSDDFSRLVLKKSGIDAYDVQEKLSKVGIDIEMAYEDMLVLIVTPYNYTKLDKLDETLKNMQFGELKVRKVDYVAKRVENSGKEIEFVKIEDAENRICASQVGVYPPSIPLVKENDLIDKSIIEQLLANKEHLFGLVNSKIAVLK